MVPRECLRRFDSLTVLLIAGCAGPGNIPLLDQAVPVARTALSSVALTKSHLPGVPSTTPPSTATSEQRAFLPAAIFGIVVPTLASSPAREASPPATAEVAERAPTPAEAASAGTGRVEEPEDRLSLSGPKLALLGQTPKRLTKPAPKKPAEPTAEPLGEAEAVGAEESIAPVAATVTKPPQGKGSSEDVDIFEKGGAMAAGSFELTFAGSFMNMNISNSTDFDVNSFTGVAAIGYYVVKGFDLALSLVGTYSSSDSDDDSDSDSDIYSISVAFSPRYNIDVGSKVFVPYFGLNVGVLFSQFGGGDGEDDSMTNVLGGGLIGVKFFPDNWYNIFIQWDLNYMFSLDSGDDEEGESTDTTILSNIFSVGIAFYF